MNANAIALSEHVSKSRPALRLIGTKALPREEWLAVRKQGIGSSDAGAAVGLNPYKSQLELWLEKTGRDATLPKIDPHDEESPAYWGNVLEPIVAWHYSKRTGKKVRRINAVLQHPDPALPWMLANIDREVIGAVDVQILECKTSGINGARLWKEGVPEYVQLQVMHQLAVTGKQAADVAVLLGGQHLEIHRIERDEQMIARLIELERVFWDYVVSDTPPPADGSASADQALRCLYPQDNGQSVDFSARAGLAATYLELKAVRQSIAEKETRESQLKQTLLQAMGEASRAEFSNGFISWRRSKDSTVLDVERLLKEKPYLQVRFSKRKEGSAASLSTDLFPLWPSLRDSVFGWPFSLPRRSTMLKGLAITPPVLGRISIGKIVEKNGKRLPEKDDQFTITSQVQSRDGWLLHPLNDELRQGKEDKLRSIPVRLLFNEPELNFRADYTLFDRNTGRPLCVGNGETCKRMTQDGMQSLPCPSPDACLLAKGGACKPYGRLNVVIGDEDSLGSFVFRTTGFNSIRTLAARLHYFQAISGHRLACLPLELRLRGKSTRQSHGTPIFYVDLTVRSGMDMTEALQKASELDTQRIAVGFDQTALDDAARRGFGNGAFEDSEEDSHVVIEEFFVNTEAASTKSQGESLPTPNSLADKLESLASQAN